MGNAREVALLALSACARQGAWSDGFLKRALRDSGMDSRDAALATRLCFGVLQNRILLDFYLSGLSRLPLRKLEERVLECLRLGAYQILFLDRVPDRAAVNESVNLARKYAKNPRSAGLVNGVLRGLVRQKESLPPPPDAAVQYSHPQWLADEFVRRLGREEAQALMAADNAQPPTMAQVNTGKASTAAAAERLRDEGVGVAPHPWLPDCLELSDTGSLERLESFRQGLFYIQDPAARLAVLAAGPEPGMKVLDACAAPGGKSFAAAIAMKNHGSILACDIHPHKQALIQAGAERLGLDCIQTQVLDGKCCKEEFLDKFDLVIADVPCSGLGIIRKKPDIRYKAPEPLENLPKVQAAILDNVARYVRPGSLDRHGCICPGGVLLYATCTLLERENEDVVRAFLDRHPNFTLEGFQVPGPFEGTDTGMLTCWPHRHNTDGFFFAKLRRLRAAYEIRPREGFGPFRLGMTEEEAEETCRRLGLPQAPQSFYLEYRDGRLSRIGLNADEDIRILYRGLELTRTHAEDVVAALSRESGLVCDCVDSELADTYDFPELGVELWRERVYHPKLLDRPEFQQLIAALPENLAYEQSHGWYFAQIWVQTDDFRAEFPLEPCRAPYDGGPWRSAPPHGPVPPEQMALVAPKYGLEPPAGPGGDERA